MKVKRMKISKKNPEHSKPLWLTPDEDVEKKVKCPICGTEQTKSEMSYHPAPHCKNCDSKIEWRFDN
jgi:DNA-directed RNA polymerase subunit RPC12/RpoP